MDSRRRLTVHLGVRYELQQARTERYNRLNNFDFTVASPLAQQTGLPFKGGLVRAFHEAERSAIRLGEDTTDAEGRYRFITIRPGEYPWRNHYNAWRPAHIHFSLFGPAFLTRMVTQMYFPGDPLLPYDPMYNCITNEAARARLIGVFDWESTIPEQALGYRFDIVLRGREETPMEKMP